MDPLSIVASITGILAAAAKVTTVVSEFVRKEKDAPQSMRSVLSELSDLTLCLVQLQPFIQGVRTAPRERMSAISVEQIITISTSLVLNMNELERLVDSFNLAESMSIASRMRWVKDEDKLTEIIDRVRASQNSLNLVLTIFSWWVSVTFAGAVPRV